MALSDTARMEAAREIARRMFPAARTAHLNLDDLKAAVGAIDTAMDALPATLNPAQTVKINLVATLPEPFKSRSTPAEKATVLVAWALKESGLI